MAIDPDYITQIVSHNELIIWVQFQHDGIILHKLKSKTGYRGISRELNKPPRFDRPIASLNEIISIPDGTGNNSDFDPPESDHRNSIFDQVGPWTSRIWFDREYGPNKIVVDFWAPTRIRFRCEKPWSFVDPGFHLKNGNSPYFKSIRFDAEEIDIWFDPRPQGSEPCEYGARFEYALWLQARVWNNKGERDGTAIIIIDPVCEAGDPPP